MRVLISAYACEPGAGSEPGTGWAWARAAALDHDAWLLTRANNAELIDAALAAEPHLRLHPVYLDLPARVRFWKRGQHGVHLYYLLWQVLARRAARRLHADHRFDVAHHVTFAVDWMPAGVIGIPGLPAVWGPVGGATGTPWNLWRWLGWRGIVSEAFREATTRPMRRLFGDRSAGRAALVVAQNNDVAQRFRHHGPLMVEPHVALDVGELQEFSIDRGRADTSPHRCAVFVGRLIPWKGLRLAIAALAEEPAHDWELHVYGDGPERESCSHLGVKLGLDGRVTFHGKRPREEVIRAVARSDALLFPSMHDSAPWAVGEAVALGVPVVYLDRGGPPVIASGAGTAVHNEGRSTPALLASTLASATAKRSPTDSWAADRLPALLEDWYRTSTTHGEPHCTMPERV